MMINNMSFIQMIKVQSCMTSFKAGEGPAEIENPGNIAENAVLERVGVSNHIFLLYICLK